VRKRVFSKRSRLLHTFKPFSRVPLSDTRQKNVLAKRTHLTVWLEKYKHRRGDIRGTPSLVAAAGDFGGVIEQSDNGGDGGGDVGHGRGAENFADDAVFLGGDHAVGQQHFPRSFRGIELHR